jgi:hypothetical protein
MKAMSLLLGKWAVMLAAGGLAATAFDKVVTNRVLPPPS